MNTVIEHIPSGSPKHMNKNWVIKEKIKENQSLLAQDWSSFTDFYKRGCVYVIKDKENTILGFAIVNDKDYLSVIAVLPSEQNKGLGSELIGNIKSEFDFFYLHVRQSNEPAIRFYKKMGLEKTGSVEEYYDNCDTAYVMSYYAY